MIEVKDVDLIVVVGIIGVIWKAEFLFKLNVTGIWQEGVWLLLLLFLLLLLLSFPALALIARLMMLTLDEVLRPLGRSYP